MIRRSRQSSRRSTQRKGLQNGLFLLLMVPAMVLGPAFANGVVLQHSHGPDGLHGHVSSATGDHDGDDHAEQHAWHANELAGHALDHHATHVDSHGHDLIHDSLHGHVPPATQVGFPTAVWPHPAGSRTAVTLARWLSLVSEGPMSPLPVHDAGPLPGDRTLGLREARPARGGHGSGAARVLRSSHALLI